MKIKRAIVLTFTTLLIISLGGVLQAQKLEIIGDSFGSDTVVLITSISPNEGVTGLSISTQNGIPIEATTEGCCQAILGRSTNGFGVDGSSVYNIGLRGFSENHYGVYGKSDFSYSGYFDGDTKVQGKLEAHSLDLGPTSGKKLAVYQAKTYEDFYGFGISDATLEFYAGSVDTAEAQMVLKKSSGNVGIGTATPARKLHLFANPSQPQIRLQDVNSYVEIWGGNNLNIVSPDGETRFKVAQDGKLTARWLRNIGDHANLQYNLVTGEIGYDNSTRRDKQDIQDLEENFEILLEAKPKTYTREWAPDRWEIGFIAEEFHELGLTPLVQYDDQGIPAGLRYDKMVTYIIPLLKQHRVELIAKGRRIEMLEDEMLELKKNLKIIKEYLNSAETH